MKDEKVYIEGYVVGFLSGTDGTREKKIQVASGEIVSIDENFIYKSIEPQKVKIPQFVADVIEDVREDSSELEQAFQSAWWYESNEFTEWYKKKSNRDVFARAWLDGYETEKEKQYLVRLKGLDKDLEYLNFKHGHVLVFSDNIENEEYRTKHTRKELEEAGFGWMFDCEGIEVEEVTE